MNLLSHFYFFIYWAILLVLCIMLFLVLGVGGLKKIQQSTYIFLDYSLKMLSIKVLLIFYWLTFIVLMYLSKGDFLLSIKLIIVIHFLILVPSTIIIKMSFFEIIEAGIEKNLIFPLISPFILFLTLNMLSLSRFVYLWAVILIINGIFTVRGVYLCLIENVHLQAKNSNQNYITIILSWVIATICNLYCFVILINSVFPGAFLLDGRPIENNLNLFYYTVITFTTTGFGDITAGNNWGYLVASFVSMCGFLFTALVIGGILAVFTNKKGK